MNLFLIALKLLNRLFRAPNPDPVPVPVPTFSTQSGSDETSEAAVD